MRELACEGRLALVLQRWWHEEPRRRDLRWEGVLVTRELVRARNVGLAECNGATHFYRPEQALRAGDKALALPLRLM